MQPRIRMGLIVGAIGLFLNVCVSAFIGVCGPAVSFLAGGVAGFFSAQQEKASTKSNGARLGAISGSIAGGLIVIGQIIGAIAALAYYQFSGTPSPFGFGTIPSISAPLSQQLIFYVSGMGTGLCFGLVGVGLAALTGAGAGYLGTPDQPAPIQQPPMQQ